MKEKKIKKLKCCVCGEIEKEVPEKVVKYYCWKCVSNNKAFIFMMKQKENL
ncbi:MAG: hypothetical protein QXL51_00580 [Candidatus Aenigmatarchaeota archaeon]